MKVSNFSYKRCKRKKNIISYDKLKSSLNSIEVVLIEVIIFHFQTILCNL